MHPTYVPANPLQALMMWWSHVMCELTSGGQCMMPM
ncbi:hypothetical protein NONO_c65490 [Nocardia nova SH22a]|uniref:Uncharacterized protein n=1 Tax=Nocardia nova SH22a TaxID=1415166 RepID=W5TQ86_9NOCA|nr:hypothetical protein NONO_c65490 [Nocardia nova SH22a]